MKATLRAIKSSWASCGRRLFLLTALVVVVGEPTRSSAFGQVARAGSGPDALPAVNEVPLAVPQPRGVGTHFGLGYGWTESVFNAHDGHHRLQLDAAVSVTPRPWFAAALRLLGRYDKHVGGSAGSDDGVVTEAHLHARAQAPINDAFVVGTQLSLWLPGADNMGDSLSAVSGDLQALGTYAPAASPLTLGLALGLRVDRSRYSGGSTDLFSPADRLGLGASDGMLAARMGLGLSYRIRQIDLIAEWSWKMYFAYAGESPMWIRAGARYRVSELWQLEALFGVSPSKRPSLAQTAPLALVEPRLYAGLAVALLFPWEAAEAPARPIAQQPLAPTRDEPEASRLRGHVLTPSGTDLSGAQITLSGDAEPRAVSSDAQGVFAVSDLPPGPYRLSVSCAGWIAHEQLIELKRGANPELSITLKRELPSGQIRGTVRRFDGRPVSATIAVSSLGVTQPTDRDGAFEINVPPGDYVVSVKARGFKPQTRKAHVEQSGVAILIVELESSGP